MSFNCVLEGGGGLDIHTAKAQANSAGAGKVRREEHSVSIYRFSSFGGL